MNSADGDGKDIMPKVNIQLDQRDYIYAAGVMIGRRVRDPDGNFYVEFCDKDRRRSSQRGSRFIYVPVTEFAGLGEMSPTIEAEGPDFEPARRSDLGESPDPEGPPYAWMD